MVRLNYTANYAWTKSQRFLLMGGMSLYTLYGRKTFSYLHPNLIGGKVI